MAANLLAEAGKTLQCGRRSQVATPQAWSETDTSFDAAYQYQPEVSIETKYLPIARSGISNSLSAFGFPGTLFTPLMLMVRPVIGTIRRPLGLPTSAKLLNRPVVGKHRPRQSCNPYDHDSQLFLLVGVGLRPLRPIVPIRHSFNQPAEKIVKLRSSIRNPWLIQIVQRAVIAFCIPFAIDSFLW
jgi:hypothetical protein